MDHLIENSNIRNDGALGQVSGPRRSLLIVIAAMAVVDTLKFFKAFPKVSIGEIDIGAFDVVSVPVAILTFVLLLRRTKFSYDEFAALIFVVYSIVTFLVSFSSRGVVAGVDYRDNFINYMILAFIIFGHSLEGFSAISRILLLIASYPVLVFILTLLGVLPSPAERIGVSFLSGYQSKRFLSSHWAMMITIGGFVLLFSCHLVRDFQKQIRVLVVALTLLAISTLSFHRSVWLATIGGLGTYFLILRWLPANNVSKAVVTYLVFLGTGAFLVVISFGIVTEFDSAFVSNFKENSTIAWRISGWVSLIDKMDWWNFFVGMGFGADQSRYFLGHEVSANAHNFYVLNLWYMGIIGLGLMFYLYYRQFYFLFYILRHTQNDEYSVIAGLLLTLNVSICILYVAYGFAFETAVVLGITIMFVKQFHSAVISGNIAMR
ncbi:MAG: hypothetical protein GKS01_11985 [Alphaproteobacteria bacterium]|nr:hypothetical protein [Alphaproteobacteria bacterium]